MNKPQQKDPCKLTIKAADAVTTVAVSSEGDRIICALKDCSLRLFDSRTSIELVSLVGELKATNPNFVHDQQRRVDQVHQ